MITEERVDEIWLSVEYDKSRESNRKSRDDPNYVCKPEDLRIDEGRLKDLRDVTDPVERARMVKAIMPRARCRPT